MTQPEQIDEIQNRMWITERCHMKAEKRSRFLELYFHIVLALFALASIGISIVGDVSHARLNESILSFTSITTLCLSLLIFGFKFGETAAKHRSCYLSLQKLRATTQLDEETLNTKYVDILGHHPNHTSGDYMRLAISDLLQAQQALESPIGTKLCISWWQRSIYACTWILARLALAAFAAMPFILVGYGIDFKSLFGL